MDPLNVAQVLAAYEASLAQVFTHQTLTTTGVLEPKNDTVYGGKLYWHLVDGDARLTVREQYRPHPSLPADERFCHSSCEPRAECRWGRKGVIDHLLDKRLVDFVANR